MTDQTDVCSDDTERELSDNLDLVDGEKPVWTDPTNCPYPDCDFQSGEVQMEGHLSNEHGWFLLDSDFSSNPLVDDRDVDTGEQQSLEGWS